MFAASRLLAKNIVFEKSMPKNQAFLHPGRLLLNKIDGFLCGESTLPCKMLVFVYSFFKLLAKHIVFEYPMPKTQTFLHPGRLLLNQINVFLLFQYVFKSLILSFIFNAFLLLNAGPLRFLPRRVCLPKL